MRIPLPFVALLALLVAGPVWAHNGRLALAPAVGGIVVDGELSDWPDYLPRYPIAVPGVGSLPEDPRDLTAVFRAAYSEQENRLFVAVEVVDQSFVLPDRSEWDGADGCELYIDTTHGRARPVQLALWGGTHYTTGDGSFTHQVEVSRKPGRHVYEWWVDVSRIAGDDGRLQSGVDLGFDVVVADVDEDGSFSWLSWGPVPNKMVAADRVGDLIVVGGGESLGEAIAEAGNVLGDTMLRAQQEVRSTAAILTFLAGALLAVTLLHGLLFAFQRQTRTNLYYAIFTGATAVAFGLAYTLPDTGLPGPAGDTALSVWIVVVYAASLLLLYAQFHGRLTPGGQVLLGWLAYAAVVRLVFPGSWVVEDPYGRLYWWLATSAYTAMVAALITIAGLVVEAVWRRRDGAWSVGVSFLVFAACAGFVGSRLLEREPVHPELLAGILLPLGAMSFRLARSVASAQRDLARRFEEVEALSQQLQAQNRQLEDANVKIVEQSRQVAEANRLKSDFLARMSHDLRTPLNAIIGYTRILLRRLDGQIDPRQYRNLENTRISADNLLSLINDILDLSRIESGRTELQVAPVDVRQVATECAAAIESLVPAGVDLVTDLNGTATLRTDGDRLRRVLMNLLGNAVKYTESGAITLRLLPQADGVELSVADTGVGIPPDDLPHIFDEFRQVERRDKKREGSGLGLAIAHRSVEMLGGKLSATSTVGQGSTFTVRLPAATPNEGGSAG